MLLSTKIAAPPNPAEAARAVESAVDAALSRLRRGRLDLLYCRAPTDAVLPLLPEIFDRQIREGKIARWGASNWPPQMLRAALVVCRAGGFAAPAAAQAPGNFLFAAPLFSLCDLAAKNKIALIGYSPFARGVLAGRYLRGVSARIAACGFEASAPHPLRRGGKKDCARVGKNRRQNANAASADDANARFFALAGGRAHCRREFADANQAMGGGGKRKTAGRHFARNRRRFRAAGETSGLAKIETENAPYPAKKYRRLAKRIGCGFATASSDRHRRG